LAGRKQIVVVDGVKSESLEVQAGVPQGSRLGPLLFIIYMNDIVNDIESDVLIFADDTSLMASGNDPDETAEQLNWDLEKISLWATKWKVVFNAKKSKDIIFSEKCLNNSHPLIFGNTFIERVNTHKHLGLFLTSCLDWTLQVNEICRKANKKLAALRSVKLLCRQTLDLFYKLTVKSVVDYALPVYYKCLKVTDLARLENLQYKAAKIVTTIPVKTS
jgi:ribonuclease P/MRP protein subunit RPP40